MQAEATMDDDGKKQDPAPSDRQEREEPVTPEVKPEQEADSHNSSTTKKKKGKCKKHDHDEAKHAKKSDKKKARGEKSESEDSSDEESEDSSSSDSTSEEETTKRRKSKGSKATKKSKSKKDRRKSKKQVESSEDESSSEEDEEEESEEEEDEVAADPSSTASSMKVALLEQQLAALKRAVLEKKAEKKPKSKKPRASTKSTKGKAKGSKGKASTKFKRVDQLWDDTIHNYKLKESAEEDESEFAEFAFLVRRTFDWENKYRDTVVDIKSKQLRGALSNVLKDCKTVSLEAEEPTVDPNILFLYLEELRTHYKVTLKAKIKAEKKRKATKKLQEQKQLLKLLVGYLDEDYADIKKTLYPLLKAGNITFELLWALYKPNDIAVTSCYGSWDEPRCFKLEYANKCASMTRGEWYCIEGRYLEYDGKAFGYGDFEVDVEAFKGPRKITSLATYPLKFHADPEKVKKQIIARGEKFVDSKSPNMQNFSNV
jgi:hypothetical protein